MKPGKYQNWGQVAQDVCVFLTVLLLVGIALYGC